MRATAAVLYEVRKPLVVEDVEVMEPGPHEVLVRWAANGVCHSDLHVMTGDYPHPLPVVLGHEAAGVVETGRGGRRDGEGGRPRLLELYPVLRALRATASAASPPCARCATSRAGSCSTAPRASAANGQPLHHFLQVAGYATHAVLPEESVIPIRKDAPLDVVCLVSCGVLAGAGPVFNRAKVPPGASVAVWGCGGVGPQHDPGRAHGGRGQDHRGGRDARRSSRGRRSSAPRTSWTRPRRIRWRASTPSAAWAEWTSPFEVVGTQKTIEQALLATHRGGTCVVVGVSPGGHADLASTRRSSSSSGCSPARPSAPATSAPTCRC